MAKLLHDVVLIRYFAFQVADLGNGIRVRVLFTAIRGPCVVVLGLQLGLAAIVFRVLLMYFAVVLDDKVGRGADAEQNVAGACRTVGQCRSRWNEERQHCRQRGACECAFQHGSLVPPYGNTTQPVYRIVPDAWMLR